MEKKKNRICLTHQESYLIIDWLKKRHKEFDGLSIGDVAELVNADKIVPREVSSHHVGNLCRQMDIKWKRPANVTSFQSAISLQESLERIEVLEEQVAFLMLMCPVKKVPTGEAK